MPTTDAANEAHADGRTLLRVAEGNSEQQPDEAMLAHIFSCPGCSATLHEMRQGLTVLSTGEAPLVTAEEALENDAELDLADAESFAAEQRARSMIWKLALVGGLLALAMLLLRSTAAPDA